MTTRPDAHPAAFDRRLTEDEKSLLCWLCIQTVCAQTGVDEQTAADVLDEFAETGEATIVGNATDCWAVFAGKPLVHVTREWLAFHAIWSRQTPAPES